MFIEIPCVEIVHLCKAKHEADRVAKCFGFRGFAVQEAGNNRTTAREKDKSFPYTPWDYHRTAAPNRPLWHHPN